MRCVKKKNSAREWTVYSLLVKSQKPKTCQLSKFVVLSFSDCGYNYNNTIQNKFKTYSDQVISNMMTAIIPFCILLSLPLLTSLIFMVAKPCGFLQILILGYIKWSDLLVSIMAHDHFCILGASLSIYVLVPIYVLVWDLLLVGLGTIGRPSLA